MTAWRWCELSICADFDLPELPAITSSSGAETEWRVSLEERAPERPHLTWFHQWTFPDGRPWVAFGRDAAGYRLHFPDLADFDIVPNARTVRCAANPQTPLHTVRHLLLDQVLPLVVGTRDSLALHGSAVATEHGALLFLGGGGDGKSTLAVTLARKGAAIVSDDCCVIAREAGGLTVIPSYAGVRLWPDSLETVFPDRRGDYDEVAHYTRKRRVTDRNGMLPFHEGRLPLARVYIVEQPDSKSAATLFSSERRPARTAMLDLLNCTFHLDVEDPARIREAFELAADIAVHCDIRRLSFPWDLSKSNAVAEAILGDR